MRTRFVSLLIIIFPYDFNWTYIKTHIDLNKYQSNFYYDEYINKKYNIKDNDDVFIDI